MPEQISRGKVRKFLRAVSKVGSGEAETDIRKTELVKKFDKIKSLSTRSNVKKETLQREFTGFEELLLDILQKERGLLFKQDRDLKNTGELKEKIDDIEDKLSIVAKALSKKKYETKEKQKY